MPTLSTSDLRFEVATEWKTALPDALSVAAFVERATGPILHESSRGRVRLADHDGGQLVLKHSFRERASRWCRLVSRFRPAEGLRAFRVMRRLGAAGARVPEAVFGLELRRRGLAIDSWHAYRFVEGRAATVDDAEHVLDTLSALHSTGWVHRDPHLGNFLINDEGVVVLDCARARPSSSAYARAFDLVLLEKCCRGLGRPHLALRGPRALLGLARAHSRSLVAWRAAKRRARTLLPTTRRGAAS